MSCGDIIFATVIYGFAAIGLFAVLNVVFFND